MRFLTDLIIKGCVIMPKHEERTAPKGVDKKHKCGLYVDSPGKYLCKYCCYCCKQRSTCINACKNTPRIENWLSRSGEKAQLKRRIQELESENAVLRSLITH